MILFFLFSVVVLTHDYSGSCLRGGFGTSLWNTPKNGCHNFWPVLTSLSLISNWLSFLTCFTWMVFPYEFLPANHSWFAADRFLFLTWSSTAILTWGTPLFTFLFVSATPLCLSLPCCLDSPSHICPSFFNVVWLTSNLAWKQFTTKSTGVPNCITYVCKYIYIYVHMYVNVFIYVYIYIS